MTWLRLWESAAFPLHLRQVAFAFGGEEGPAHEEGVHAAGGLATLGDRPGNERLVSFTRPDYSRFAPEIGLATGFSRWLAVGSKTPKARFSVLLHHRLQPFDVTPEGHCREAGWKPAHGGSHATTATG